jgi:hypothetical protein
MRVDRPVSIRRITKNSFQPYPEYNQANPLPRRRQCPRPVRIGRGNIASRLGRSRRDRSWSLGSVISRKNR